MSVAAIHSFTTLPSKLESISSVELGGSDIGSSAGAIESSSLAVLQSLFSNDNPKCEISQAIGIYQLRISASILDER